MKKVLLILVILMISSSVFAKPKETKSRFYDFSDQLIDGSIRKPPTIWMQSRTRVKFEKLLSLKKSFYKELLLSNKEAVLK